MSVTSDALIVVAATSVTSERYSSSFGCNSCNAFSREFSFIGSARYIGVALYIQFLSFA